MIGEELGETVEKSNLDHTHRAGHLKNIRTSVGQLKLNFPGIMCVKKFLKLGKKLKIVQ